MPETVRLTFQFALGQQVQWAQETHLRWRVLERWYLEGEASQARRYLIITARDTWTALAEESDLSPLKETP